MHGLESLPEAAETQVCGVVGRVAIGGEYRRYAFRPEHVTEQLPLPLQAPPQPIKLMPAAGVAVSVTTVLLPKIRVQVDGQWMPVGLLVTVPLPVTLTTSW